MSYAPSHPRPGLPALVLLALVAVTSVTLAQSPAGRMPPDAVRRALAEHRNLDARAGLLVPAAAPLAAQQAEVNDLRATLRDLRVDFDTSTGATRSLWNMGGYLSPPDGRDARAIADDFVASRTTLLGLSASDVVEAELTDAVHSPLSGVTHLYYRQRVSGVPVYNAQLQLNVTRDGRILSVNNAFLPNITAAVSTLRPAMAAAAAVTRAASHLGLPGIVPAVARAERGMRQRTELVAPDLSLEPIVAELMIVPIRKGEARLAWNFQVWTYDGNHAFDFTVDAESGQIWTRTDWAAADAYRVYPRPVESPNHTSPLPPADGRAVVSNPAQPAASPFGWHDINGVAGAEFTTTEGNNVSAYTDTDADDLPDPGSAPDCGPSLSCDFPIDLSQPPSAYRPAAVTNLFYWSNIVHDVQYRYGFDEAAGNFQVNNYGRGGVGNDSVRAEAQDGMGFDNATFATPPDGERPRMQMYLFDRSFPFRDASLDAGVIVHEYGHGISNRLVGGPANVNCLANPQQPGEGISDWLALVYTAVPGQTGATPRGIGTYVMNQPPTGPGIRTQPYSTDPSVNTFTYASISSGLTVPHGVGSVWAQGMWEVYWALVDQYGFDPDLYNATGAAGNQRAMLYHAEGLKNTACSPGFTQVRDGIIQAAQTLHGGADVCRLWSAFAAFGLGTNAVNPSPASVAGIVNGFDVPVACGGTGNPALSIDDVSVAEGNSGTSTATFTLSLATPPTSEARVNYVVAEGTATAPATTFSAAAPVTIPAFGPASIYPIGLDVAGLPGVITGVAVRLDGFSHTAPQDVDMLLVGPGGQRSLFMSDIGSGVPVSGISLTFRDGAPAPSVPLVGGTVAPTNITDVPNDDGLPAPAPAGPYDTALSVFNGTIPNGAWTLYVRGDGGHVGSLAGFSLIITTSAVGDFIPAGGQVTFPPGVQSRTIAVGIHGDTVPEPDETFVVNLSSPVNAVLVDAQGIGTILNDDPGGGGGTPTSAGDAFAATYPFPVVVPPPGVLGNDSANGGGPMTAVQETSPTHGVLTLGADGGFSYTPAFGFAGIDSFIYRARNAAGEGNVATVTITVAPPVTVQPPYNLRVDTVADNVVTLRWDVLPIGAQPSTFVLEGGLAPLEVLASYPTGSASPVYTFVAPPGSFYIRMRAKLGADQSPPSNEVLLHVTTAVPPSAPVNLLGLANGSRVDLTWKNIFGGGVPSGLILDVTGSATVSFALPVTERFSFAPVPGGTYTFRVREVNAAGSSPPSSPLTLAFPPVSCTGAPQPPAHFLAYRVENSVYARWDPPAAGAAPTGYVLSVISEYFTGPLFTTERAIGGPVPGGTYSMSVTATNACGTSLPTPAQVVVVP